MSFRQIVIDALDHKEAEHTPWAFEVTSAFRDLYEAQYHVSDPETDLESHVLFGKYKRMRWLDENVYEDIFGVQWKTGDDGGDIGVPINKIMSADDIEAYIFPEFDEAELEKGLAQMREDDTHFRMFRMTYTMYERAWSLVGMTDLLMLMALDEKQTHRIFERVTEYQLALLDRVLDEPFEGVYLGDDWGQQKGMIMGPEYFRTYIKPNMKKLCDKIKSKGKYVLLHSCGDVGEVLPDMIEIGIDAFNTVQPEIYDLAEIKREYGRDLTFWGAMSTQQFLPFANAEEVYAKSVETIRLLGKGGGYIFSPTHAVAPDTPPENLRAMRDAAKSTRW